MTVALACGLSAGAACGVGSDDAPAPREGPAAATEGLHPAGPGTGMAARPRPTPTSEAVGVTTCSRCHDGSEVNHTRWRETAMKAGHDVDRLVEGASLCNCCHLGEIRGFGEPLTEGCNICHADVHVTIPRMASQHCLSCHDLSGHDLKLGAWECQRCHSDAEHPAAVDVHAGEDCSICHQPHQEPWVLPQGCEDCHAAQAETRHGSHPIATELVCDDCHKPHEVAGEASSRCVSCHEEAHPGFAAGAVFRGHDACTNCHEPHAFDAASARTCESCHKDLPMLASHAKGHDRCDSCHTHHCIFM
jgi:hypothetical protein